MYNNKNPAQCLHTQGHEARLRFCVWVRDSEGTHVTERLLCVSKADAMLAEIGARLSGSNSISTWRVCIRYAYPSNGIFFPAAYQKTQ